MTDQRLLYFTADGHDAYRCARGALQRDASFGVDERGAAGFRAYLREHPRAVYRVLADIAGEEFHEDLIPLLRGAERAAVVGRRLAQRFRDTRLVSALSLGEVKEERRNERLLLASFSQPAQFAPWLDAIAAAGVKLAGVYSVPLLAPALAARLGEIEDRSFLASVNRGGLRQCFLDRGRLRFARLQPLQDSSPAAIAAALRAETALLAQYLAALRALPREGPPLRVTLIAPASAAREIEQALERAADEHFAFRVVALDKALGAAGLRRVPQQAGAELCYLALAAKAPPAEQFAQRTERSRFFVWRMRRAILAGGALLFAACALLAGGMWRETLEARQLTELARREARAAGHQYQRIAAALPEIPSSAENLKATVDEFQRIAARSASPEAMLAHLSRVLERYPNIRIDALTWNAAPPATPASAPHSAGDAAAAMDDATESLEIVGRLEPPRRSDLRRIVDEIERFAQALRDAGLRSGKLKLPFDVTPEGELTGDTRTDAAQSGETNFSLLVSKVKP
jgi:hypothetical protein